jgi:hypothetical protein
VSGSEEFQRGNAEHEIRSYFGKWSPSITFSIHLTIALQFVQQDELVKMH